MDVLRVPDALSSRLPGRLGESASGPVVSLVRLHGVISPQPSPVPRSVINAANLEKVLERAFAPATARRGRAAGQLAGRVGHAVRAGR